MHESLGQNRGAVELEDECSEASRGVEVYNENDVLFFLLPLYNSATMNSYNCGIMRGWVEDFHRVNTEGLVR